MFIIRKRPFRTACVLVSALASIASAAPAASFRMQPPGEVSLNDLLTAAAADIVQLPQRPGREYRITRQLSPEGWFQLDLRPWANWAYAYGPGISRVWIDLGPGFDLSPLRPGRQYYYGVPFEIIDASENDGKSCLVVRSDRLNDPDIPVSLSIPVNRRAAVLYFLHGCGWATWGQNLRYRIVYADGTSRVQLIRPAAEVIDQGENIGDWFGNQPLRTEQARPVPLLRGTRLIFIYTLEWRNPAPEKEIAEIIFEGDGAGLSTIILLAISGNSG